MPGLIMSISSSRWSARAQRRRAPFDMVARPADRVFRPSNCRGSAPESPLKKVLLKAWASALALAAITRARRSLGFE